MQRVALSISLVALFVGAVACSPPEGDPVPRSEPAETEPQPSPDATVYDRISSQGYPGWRVAPGYQVPQPTEGPHGEMVQIFLNEVAADAREDGLAAWPEGSIIVKDAYVEHTIERVLVMEKAGGSWQFSEWDTDGRSVAEAGEQACRGCHDEGSDGTLAVRTAR